MSLSSDFSILYRGEVWWANLPAPVGSEPGYRRPVLIIQINRFNRSRLATGLAQDLRSSPQNTRLASENKGLQRPCSAYLTSCA